MSAMRIAALSGSLCAVSGDVTVRPLSLGGLPLFDPEFEECLPPAGVDFRLPIPRADALIIAGPEYAHGIKGVLKSALESLAARILPANGC